MFEKVSGQKIKEAIKKAGYTQEKFSKKIATKQSMISQWITGKRNPSLKSLEKIAVATGKPLSYFFDSSIGSNNAIGSNAVSEINDVQNATISLKRDTEIELLKKEIENLKLKLEIEQLKNGKKK